MGYDERRGMKSNTLLFKIYICIHMNGVWCRAMTWRITPLGSRIQTMEWACETYIHDDKGWRGWVFLDDIYHNTTKQQINARTRASQERWRQSKWRSPFPLYSQASHGEMLPRPNLFYCSLREGLCLRFFPSAIGLVFKRTVEFHVRH